jgi:uncharacterized protein (DUF2461 family)
MTQVALRTHKKDMMREDRTFSKQKFLYRLSRSDYEKNWGKEYSKPGPGARVLSVFFHYLPKIGPFKAMAFKSPTPKTEEMYFKSINTTVDQYRAYLEALRTNSLQLADVDFDTGKATRAAEYSLTDNAYAKLLAKLSERKFDQTLPELRANILNFYGDLSAPLETKKDSAGWQAVLASLDQLKALTPVTHGPAVAAATAGGR